MFIVAIIAIGLIIFAGIIRNILDNENTMCDECSKMGTCEDYAPDGICAYIDIPPEFEEVTVCEYCGRGFLGEHCPVCGWEPKHEVEIPVCPRCGCRIIDGECPVCDQDKPAGMIHCTACGSLIDARYLNCPECGHELERFE